MSLLHHVICYYEHLQLTERSLVFSHIHSQIHLPVTNRFDCKLFTHVQKYDEDIFIFRLDLDKHLTTSELHLNVLMLSAFIIR